VEGPALRLAAGETAVVGYGSLLSRESIGKTLNREYDGPFLFCHVAGWRRTWDVWMPNGAFYYIDSDERVYPEKIVYLNVQPSPGVKMNCVLFVLRDAELRLMHQREWIYAPTDVNPDLRGVHLDSGTALMYVARKEYLLQGGGTPREAAIRRSYLSIVEQGLRRTTAAFRADYEATTEPAPGRLVIDDLLDRDRLTT
jgi:hypothetical protein